MAADPNNAAIWANADVYTAPLGSTLPADASTAFNGSWTLVGLLDGADGFTENRTMTETDHYAWGGILVRTARTNFKLIKEFSVLEDNATTRALFWPGSSATTIVVPTAPAKVMIAFETRDATGKVRRMITRNYAQVDVSGPIQDNEANLKKIKLAATIFPDTNGVLFDVQGKPTITTIAIAALTLALSLGGAAIKKLVATATYSDASTGDISALCLWSSDAAARATVASPGYVTAVSVGTANVTCSYAGINATAPSVVTVGV